MDGNCELFAHVEIILPGDRRNLVDGFEPAIKEAFQTATRYQKQCFPNGDLVNFGRILDGHSWIAFAKEITGDMNGNGEAVFEWLYTMSKFAIGLEHVNK